MRAVIGAGRAVMCSMAAVLLCSAPSWAQNYPVKTVRYVVPFPGGSGNDMVGRLITDSSHFVKHSTGMNDFVNRKHFSTPCGSEAWCGSP